MAGRVISIRDYLRRRAARLGLAAHGWHGWNESLDRLERHLTRLKQTRMVAMIAPEFAAYPDDRRLELVREFDAPRELVWRAFADPYHLSQWWGPKGFTNPVCEIDLRTGGTWHNVMRSPEGKEFPVDAVFIEVVPPERIVYRNAVPDAKMFDGNPPPSFIRVITFTDLGDGRTRLELTACFDTSAAKDTVVRRGFREGTEESFDRLAAHLATQTGGTR